MSFGHSEVSFNHSCLKVPVNSSTRRPAPKYERLLSAKNSELKPNNAKRECLSDIINFKSVKKYLEFYESIPDYSELHHLSNEEFYSRLKSLKITQKCLSSEVGLWSFANSEDELSSGKYSCCFGDREKKKSELKVKTCSVCSVCKDYCGVNDFCKQNHKIRDGTFGDVKQPPPKINIISDYENGSDLCDPESKKHSDYEADQESSTLLVNEKPPIKESRNRSIEDEYHRICSRRQSLSISPGCECESVGLCHGFSDVIFGNGCRLSAYNALKKNSRSLAKKKKFHTRPIPLTSRIPLFDKIMFEKEARRRAIHNLYSEELRSSVKPFSFTKREETKERLRMISSNPELTTVNPPVVRFKAKPIPKNLFSNYAYEKMKEDEFYRALKKRVRAEEMLKSSSLPPSMALREKKLRSKSLDFLDFERSPRRTWNKICGYKRACKNIKKEIEFDEKVKNGSPQKRKHRSAWMSNSRRINSATDSSTEISPYEGILNPEKRRRGRPHSAFSCSRNNLASVLRIETARKRLEKEMEEKLNESRLKNQAKLKAHLARMDPAWRALRYDKNEDLTLRMATRRQEERLKQENHRRLMESIYGRVYSMPPLFHKERFINGRNTKSRNSSNDKDVAGFSHNGSFEKLENDDEKNSKPCGFSATFREQENSRSRFSSESGGTCEKNEKIKVYESDYGTNDT